MPVLAVREVPDQLGVDGRVIPYGGIPVGFAPVQHPTEALLSGAHQGPLGGGQNVLPQLGEHPTLRFLSTRMEQSAD